MSIETSAVIEILLGMGHKESHVLDESIDASEVDVTLVHNVEGARF